MLSLLFGMMHVSASESLVTFAVSGMWDIAVPSTCCSPTRTANLTHLGSFPNQTHTVTSSPASILSGVRENETVVSCPERKGKNSQLGWDWSPHVSLWRLRQDIENVISAGISALEGLGQSTHLHQRHLHSLRSPGFHLHADTLPESLFTAPLTHRRDTSWGSHCPTVAPRTM